MTEVIAARSLNSMYIWLDIGFLFLLAGLLIWKKRGTAFWVGILAGIIYFVVDYGGFYLLLGTRTVVGADPFWFLLWLSMSYGFTNFVWIWLWLDKDEFRVEATALILVGWLSTALVSQNFGGSPSIQISRGTGSYHGIMALILFVGYAIVCVYNMNAKRAADRIPILYLMAIGVSVQFGWEFMLLVTGIRPTGIAPLVVNSLLETNLGLPYMYFIHKLVTKRPAQVQSLSPNDGGRELNPSAV